MIPVTNLRKGTIFKEKDTPFLVLRYTHTKMGRGTANIKVKVKNLKTGETLERTFLSGRNIKEAEVTRRSLQFLYSDQASAFFMDPKTFEQINIPKDLINESQKLLKEGEKITVLFYEGKPINLEFPRTLTLKVTQTGSGFKGDSTTNVYKQAVLETGLKILVPMFIKVGDTVKVNTETREYVERIQSELSGLVNK